MISELSKDSIQKFIQDHLYDDPAALMLKASQEAGLPMKAIVEQVQAKRKAKEKLPAWFNAQGIIYPPKVSMEQCSSETTAQYKAAMVSGDTMVDLTGGFGVDTYYLSQSFEKAHYVERQTNLVELARHNFKQLGADHIECFEDQATQYLEGFENKTDLIYLDPARRGTQNEKVFRLQDCEPNVMSMLPLLLEKSRQVLIKTSPMLDIKGALADLSQVEAVHVVADRNEVKELIFLMGPNPLDEPKIHCVNFKNSTPEVLQFTYSQEESTEVTFGELSAYLYEPNAAILKAGAFRSVATKFGLTKLHANTHLYTHDDLLINFPGRVFKVLDTLSMNKKDLRKKLPALKANISARNFPMTVAQIRKKTGLKEGGDDYVFATQDTSGAMMVLCQKAFR